MGISDDDDDEVDGWRWADICSAGGDKDNSAKMSSGMVRLRDLFMSRTLSAARRTEPQNKPLDGS